MHNQLLDSQKEHTDMQLLCEGKNLAQVVLQQPC